MRLETVLKAAVNSMIRGHHVPHCYSAHVIGQGYVNKGGAEHDKADYLRQLERDANSEIEDMGFAREYAERGYTQPKKGILFANWNRLPEELGDILERMGYEIEWSDEWTTCEGCNRAIRTSPDNHGWKQAYVIYDNCEIFCIDCVKEDLDEYEDYLLNSTSHADTFDIDWKERGFNLMNAEHYETGLHPHQNDDPKKIAKRVPLNHDFLFAIPSVGQFDIYFDCWIRAKKEED